MDQRQLKLAFWNVNGLRRRMEEVRQFIQTHEIDVMAVCGTRLSEDMGVCIEIEGFQMERHEREQRKGGVALYIKNGLLFGRKPAYENKDIDIIWCQRNVTKPILVGCCYRPSNARKDYLKEICELTKDVAKEPGEKDIFLMGTFNIDWKQDTPKKTRLAAAAEESELRQITAIQDPYNDDEGKCNDHIYTNVQDNRYTYEQLRIPQSANTNLCHIVMYQG